ncbi:sulfotransferase family 2 domain-containing protein [Thalassomonas actiniarum]|uniref:Sulfotransferase family 2 domain-containing protein n=1 Tax=Thalassomonas actiniarum TaxID=485447 RepID=A0AAE9YVX4_9GAMM|nr:sulfotransferase family 2 domain-containing protein [Thalassomonas actiniarum]WDE00533.1 sulfotransferase family 2 domain-containing protein [Thalassomonas actiniarum]
MISTFDQCLFVHIPKVAGQSIESAFLARAGLSWQQREAFLLRPNKDPALGPPRLAHLTALEYLELGYLEPEVFTRLFKFSFVRNPWDRLVSEYTYRQYKMSFKDFLFRGFPTVKDDDYALSQDLYRHVLPQHYFLYDQEGKLLVDFVGKFENLQQDFARVSEIITGQVLPLPHKNETPASGARAVLSRLFKQKKKKTTKPHYREYYDEESRAFVADLYQQDIALFDYQF